VDLASEVGLEGVNELGITHRLWVMFTVMVIPLNRFAT
jgi:hypothetical protein